jgi:hypothetical protein
MEEAPENGKESPHSAHANGLIDVIYLLAAIGLTPGGSGAVHIYTQTIHRTTQSTQTMHRTTQLTGPSSKLIVLCLPTKTKQALILPSMHATCSAHLLCLQPIILITHRSRNQDAPHYLILSSLLLCPFLTTLILKHPQSMFFPRTDRPSHIPIYHNAKL